MAKNWSRRLAAKVAIKSMVWAIGLCMYICFFGYSRVWSISRFHHTVVMGVLGALIGNVLYYFFCENLRSIRQQNQIFATTVASIGLFVWLLVNIESNSANGFGIPKAEYIRVLKKLEVKESHNRTDLIRTIPMFSHLTFL